MTKEVFNISRLCLGTGQLKKKIKVRFFLFFVLCKSFVLEIYETKNIKTKVFFDLTKTYFILALSVDN